MVPNSSLLPKSFVWPAHSFVQLGFDLHVCACGCGFVGKCLAKNKQPKDLDMCLWKLLQLLFKYKQTICECLSEPANGIYGMMIGDKVPGRKCGNRLSASRLLTFIGHAIRSGEKNFPKK